jgi:hypothetical protein
MVVAVALPLGKIGPEMEVEVEMVVEEVVFLLYCTRWAGGVGCTGWMRRLWNAGGRLWPTLANLPISLLRR